MGLFDVFKKKGTPSEVKVALAYDSYNKDRVSNIFPGGKAEAASIIRSLAKLYGINLENADAGMYQEILQTYSDAWIRHVITQSSDEHIMASLQVRHKTLVTNKDIAVSVKHFFTSVGKKIFTQYSKQYFTSFGKDFFTVLGKQIFTYIAYSFWNLSGCLSL